MKKCQGIIKKRRQLGFYSFFFFFRAETQKNNMREVTCTKTILHQYLAKTTQEASELREFEVGVEVLVPF